MKNDQPDMLDKGNLATRKSDMPSDQNSVAF